MKDLWNKLAKINPKYYINSDYGKGITEEQFRRSGQEDTIKYLLSDNVINTRFNLKECKLLEIGCGTGRMTEFIADAVKDVVGIDISAEMINIGEDRLSKLTNVTLMETEGNKVPLPDNYFDIAFSYLVFQHMKTKQMVRDNFAEVYRTLRPKGLFKVRLRTDNITDKVLWWAWWAGVYYKDDEIRQLYSEIGYHLEKFEYVGNYGVWLWLTK